jgi:hypothetical protein
MWNLIYCNDSSSDVLHLVPITGEDSTRAFYVFKTYEMK